MEKITPGGTLKLKGQIVKHLTALDDICKEMLDLAQQIHVSQGRKEEAGIYGSFVTVLEREREMDIKSKI